METFFNTGLGLGLAPKDLAWGQILLRTSIVFFTMLLMMRLAGLRFLAGKTTFDVLLGFIMASMLSRAINGSAPFFGTLAAGFLTVILHRLLAWLTCRFHRLGCLLKGTAEIIVQNGKIRPDALARHRVSEHDLMEDIRLNASVNDLEAIKVAQIERNGEISIQFNYPPATISMENDGKTIHVHFLR